MKIGLLTFHDTMNFGATLQAVALYQVIKKMGYDIEIIDYRCKNIDLRELPKRKYDLSNGSIKEMVYFWLTKTKKEKKYLEIHRFLYENTQIGERCYKKDLNRIDKKYDTFLIGSDMLWELMFTDYDYTYFLDFASENKKKIAFSTSMANEWSDTDFNVINEYLKRFQHIALREGNIVEYLKSRNYININQVCDPTMLLDPKEWKKYITKSNLGDYAVVYMDGNKCKENAIKYSKKNKLPLYEMGIKNPLKLNKKYKTIDVYSIEDFLNIIYHAKILFTASYHGMLFAIYYHVPFVYFNKDANRLQSLAKILGLTFRNGDIYQVDTMKEINWDEIDSKRKSFKNQSEYLLKTYLED